MMKILSSNQIREIEELADKNGITFLRLMENAGSACAKVIRNKFDDSGLRRVTVVCGKGKNGGDGFVIARKLHENGYNVSVLLAMGEPSADTAVEMYSRLLKLGVDIEKYDEDNEKQIRRLQKADIIVDCVFGTGFSGTPDQRLSKLFGIMSECDGFVVSVDLPSGMCADSTEINGAVVKADMTIAVIALKFSLVYYPSAEFAGDIKVVSIGIPDEIISGFHGGFSLSAKEIKSRFKKRQENSNKGDYGKGLIIAGSYRMPGAALLSSAAAVESGIGLLKLAFPDSAYCHMMNMTPEKVLIPLQSNRYGRISLRSSGEILEELKKSTAVLIGCGMGVDYDTKAVTRLVLENAEVPVILDADGINCMSDGIDIIKRAKAPVIITPHPGEAARLLNCSVNEVQSDRTAAAKRLFELTGAVVVLKGSRTVVTHNGRDFYINMTGNSGLATGGSGDVLAGLVLSFVCQGMSPFWASVGAVHAHGAAGDITADKYSQMGTTPVKLLAEISRVMSNYE